MPPFSFPANPSPHTPPPPSSCMWWALRGGVTRGEEMAMIWLGERSAVPQPRRAAHSGASVGATPGYASTPARHCHFRKPSLASPRLMLQITHYDHQSQSRRLPPHLSSAPAISRGWTGNGTVRVRNAATVARFNRSPHTFAQRSWLRHARRS